MSNNQFKNHGFFYEIFFYIFITLMFSGCTENQLYNDVAGNLAGNIIGNMPKREKDKRAANSIGWTAGSTISNEMYHYNKP